MSEIVLRWFQTQADCRPKSGEIQNSRTAWVWARFPPIVRVQSLSEDSWKDRGLTFSESEAGEPLRGSSGWAISCYCCSDFPRRVRASQGNIQRTIKSNDANCKRKKRKTKTGHRNVGTGLRVILLASSCMDIFFTRPFSFLFYVQSYRRAWTNFPTCDPRKGILPCFTALNGGGLRSTDQWPFPLCTCPPNSTGSEWRNVGEDEFELARRWDESMTSQLDRWTPLDVWFANSVSKPNQSAKRTADSSEKLSAVGNMDKMHSNRTILKSKISSAFMTRAVEFDRVE